jgi:hypothetical protein
VARVDEVAGDRDERRGTIDPVDGGGQVGGVAGVDDQAPAVGGEGAGQREAEASRGAGDECGWGLVRSCPDRADRGRCCHRAAVAFRVGRRS